MRLTPPSSEGGFSKIAKQDFECQKRWLRFCSVRTGAPCDRKGKNWEKRCVFRKIFLFGKNEKFSNRRFGVKNTQKMEAVGKIRSSGEDGHAPCDRQIFVYKPPSGGSEAARGE